MSQSTRQITLTWTHPTNVVDKFEIYRDDKPIDVTKIINPIGIVEVNDLSNDYIFNDFGEFKPKTKYYYVIKSVASQSFFSNIIEVTTGDWEVPKTITPIFEWNTINVLEFSEDKKSATTIRSSEWVHMVSSNYIVPNVIKQYIEIYIENFGLVYPDSLQVGLSVNNSTVGNSGSNGKMCWGADGRKRKDGIYSSYAEPFNTGDILGFSVQVIADNIVIHGYKNGRDMGEMFSISKNNIIYVLSSSYNTNVNTSTVRVEDLRYLPDDAFAWGTINEI